MSKQKRMKNGAFLGVWIGAAVLMLGIAVAAHIAFENKGIKTILDTYVNKGAAHVTEVEGADQWDTDYYKQSYDQNATAGGNAEAAADAENVVEEICDEGMVLLKNKGNALPIATTNEITLLGRGAVDPVYGGSGSGNVDTTTCANPKSGLEDAGFHVDEDAYNFFKNNYTMYNRQAIVMDNYQGSTFFIGEIPTSAYDFTAKNANVALVFISRCGGEGLDLSTNLKREANTNASQTVLNGQNGARMQAEVANYADDQHQLELSKEERDMIAFAKQNYAKTFIVLNESTTMEIGDLMDDDEIDGIIWAGSPGSTGFKSLGKILSGAINPSGRTPDIYARDFMLDPTWQNFAINGVHEYTGIDTSKLLAGVNGTMAAHFVQYEEGIYIGYKYYETRGSVEGESWYNQAVAAPFGYGLSYTTFDKEIVGYTDFGNEISMNVKVTNTGTVAGKEVVQLYYTAPYTAGSGLEKASTNLADFAKTKLLAAGESETVTVKVAVDEMSSYDYKVNKAYVLDAGEYVLQIKENSHEVSTHGGEKLERTHNELFTRVLEKRESDKTNVTNRFDDVSAMFKDEATSGYALNMTRDNFNGTFPSAGTAADADANAIQINGKALKELFYAFNFDDVTVEDAKMPTTGVANGLSLSSMRGIAYEDEAWDLLLDQLTDEDYTNCNNFLNNNAYSVHAIESIGLSDGELHDGPQGFSTLMGTLRNVCAYMSEPLLAATFNKDLAKKMGTAIGEESLALNPRYNGWYGPAMNTHRSPFAGRNFEYYSEDGVLAGKIGAAVCSGAADKGLIVFIKHFALNDQETWRTAHLATWANEQALREIYLKPFEICVKEAKTEVRYLNNGVMESVEMNATLGVMSSFNYVGGTWAGGRHDLMYDVLRDEWGFRGVVSSDFNLYDYMSPMQGVWAGTDLQLTWMGARLITNTDNARGRTVIRQAIHNLAFALANSNAMQGVAPGASVWYDISPWRIWGYVIEGVLLAGALASCAWIVIRMMKVKKEEQGAPEEPTTTA